MNVITSTSLITNFAQLYMLWLQEELNSHECKAPSTAPEAGGGDESKQNQEQEQDVEKPTTSVSLSFPGLLLN